MARDIDWGKPLTGEDWEWLAQRQDAYRTQIEDNERRFGRVSEAVSRDDRITELRGLIEKYTNELERLEQEKANEANPNNAIAGVPEEGRAIRDNTGVDGETPEGAPEAEEDYLGDEWTVKKLQAEIEARNVDREASGLDPISAKGTKAELIERLQQDDREIAESGE